MLCLVNINSLICVSSYSSYFMEIRRSQINRLILTKPCFTWYFFNDWKSSILNSKGVCSFVRRINTKWKVAFIFSNFDHVVSYFWGKVVRIFEIIKLWLKFFIVILSLEKLWIQILNFLFAVDSIFSKLNIRSQNLLNHLNAIDELFWQLFFRFLH